MLKICYDLSDNLKLLFLMHMHLHVNMLNYKYLIRMQLFFCVYNCTHIISPTKYKMIEKIKINEKKQAVHPIMLINNTY